MTDGIPPPRYSDQEVALVLRRAAEIEERHGTGGGTRGLTRSELESIAQEAGFSVEAVRQALTELRRPVPSIGWLGPAAAARRARAVEGRLSQEAMHQLLQLVEDRVSASGTVTEALGTVRWTSVPDGSRAFHLTQVAITPTDSETHLHITSRYSTRLRAIVQALPAGWGAIIGMGIGGSAGLASLSVAGVVLAGALIGAGIGRSAWHLLSRSNARRADRLSDALAESARALLDQDSPREF